MNIAEQLKGLGFEMSQSIEELRAWDFDDIKYPYYMINVDYEINTTSSNRKLKQINNIRRNWIQPMEDSVFDSINIIDTEDIFQQYIIEWISKNKDKCRFVGTSDYLSITDSFNYYKPTELFKFYIEYCKYDRTVSLKCYDTCSGILNSISPLDILSKDALYIPVIITIYNSVYVNEKRANRRDETPSLGINISEDKLVMEKLSNWISNGGVINPKVWYIIKYDSTNNLYLKRDLIRSPRKY